MCTNLSRMIHLLVIVFLGLFSNIEGSHMGNEFLVQFPYMPEGQPILMMYSTRLDSFDVYVTAPLALQAVFKRIQLKRFEVSSYTVQRKYLALAGGSTSSIVAKGKLDFGMTVFLAISLHSAASFQAIPSAGWGVEYFVLVPKLGPSIIVISLVNDNEIKIRFAEEMETLASYFTEHLLSTVAVQRKEAYIMQNCTGRTVGEKPLGVTPVKLTSLFAFGVIIGSCEKYEFKSECERADIKIAGGATAEMVFPLMSWGKQFILPSILKKSCEQSLRFLTHKPNTVILVTSNEESQVINVAEAGAMETQRLTSPSIIHVKTSEQIMLYVDYEYPCVKEEDVRFQELVMVVPMHLFMNEYTWSTPSARGYTPAHYISIVAPIDNFFIDIDTRKVSLRWKRDTINRWQTAFSRLEPGTHYISSLTGIPFGMYVVGLTPDYQFIHIAGFHVALDNQESCERTAARYNDGLDNDCDGLIDEERENLKDDDFDGEIDEDMASYASINVTGLSLPLPMPVPPFVAGYLPPECPCPSINSCQMEMCQELNAYIVCLESIVTQTNCDIKTRMEAMRKLRLREIKNSSLSSCISQCPTFLHSCIPAGANTEAKMSCRQYASYLGCLKAVSNNPSCPRTFKDEAERWIIVTENMEIKNLCLQEVAALDIKNISESVNPSDGGPAPEGWHKITGKCIKLIVERKQYAVAVESCSKMESQLLTIMSGDETSEVDNYLTNGEEINSTYVGLKKEGDQWQWDSDDTNSTIQFADWGVEASNDSLNESNNCAVKDKSLGFKWRPVPCNSEHGFICQKSCGAEPLSKSSIYQIRDKFYIANSGSPALRTLIKLVREQEKLQIFKGRCPADPKACAVTGLDKCLNVHTQFDCFQEILRNRRCSKKLKALSVVMLTSLLNECYPPQAGGTTIPTESTIPEGQTDFPINLYTTTEEIFKITASISTRDPASPATPVTTVSLSPGAYCDDLFKRCEPTSAERIAWCQNVDIHWNCMKGILNTKVCSGDSRQRASDWMIENGRPQHCPPTTTTDIPDSIIGIEDLICGPPPKCADSDVNSETICEEDSAGRAQLKCLNEIIDRDFCFPKEAETAKTTRMRIIDNMLDFNCEGLNYDLVRFVQFEPDCEQCITLGRSTLFFYYTLNTTLNANGQCNKLYFDYCNGDENECDQISSWDTACTFESDCSDLKTDPNLRTHPIEAMCNIWEDENTVKQVIVTIPTYLFRSVNYRYRARLSSDFSASNKSAIFGVSKSFIVKNLIDENKAIVEPRSTSGADNPHDLSIFWYIVVAALNVAALVTGV
ncbi:uncharacterized protein LOC131929400 [Physella acuta]|uniref:uncharacterized protein LOC131929400 n=1 Tax=Physella acuta TaxID=109671 RepID=UPI0027DC6953|nr:uncharacterized protein LOC131929400 [Physella acuta]